MHYLLWGFFGLIGQWIMGSALREMLDASKRYEWIFVLIKSVFGWLRVLMVYLGRENWQVFINICIISGIVLTIWLTDCKIWKSFLASSLVMAFSMLAELLAYATYPLPKEALVLGQTGMEIYEIWMLTHLYLLEKGLVFLWKKIYKNEVVQMTTWVLFPLILNSYLMIFGVFSNFKEDFITSMGVLGIVIPMIIPIISICYVWKRQSQKEKVELELNELKHQMEMNREYYKYIENKCEKTARFRHDFNNYLIAVRKMEEQGNENTAKELFRKMDGIVN